MLDLTQLPLLQHIPPQHEKFGEVQAELQKLLDFRRRLPAPPSLTTATPRMKASALVTYTTLMVGASPGWRVGYLVMGVTLTGLCWFAKTCVTSQIRWWKKHPFSEVLGSWVPTQEPGLIFVQDLDCVDLMMNSTQIHPSENLPENPTLDDIERFIRAQSV